MHRRHLGLFSALCRCVPWGSDWPTVAVAACLIIGCGLPAWGQGTAADYERMERFQREAARHVYRSRVEPHWSPDSRGFWYRNDGRDGVREFVLVDTAAGSRRPAFDHAGLAAELARRTGKDVDAARLPLRDLQWVGNNTLAFPWSRQLWRIDVATGAVDARPLIPPPPALPESPSHRRSSSRRGGSPDGRWSVVVRDHNLWLREAEGEAESALTTDGTAEHFYEARFDWSPDSRWLIGWRTIPGEEHWVHLIESAPKDQVQPKLHRHFYHKPGDRLPVTKPCLFDIEARRAIALPDALFPNPWGITDTHWTADSSRFSFVYNERGHQVLRLVEVDATTASVRGVIEERSATFIDYAYKKFLHRLDATSEAIWMSERDGWNHLYLYDTASGQVKNQITRGEWVVRGVDRVDPEARQIWFQAGGIDPQQDPYHVLYCRVNFDGSGLTVLTPGNGTHEIQYSPDGACFVDRYSRVDLPPVSELRRTADGSLICALETADIADLAAMGWQAPEPFVAPGRDGVTPIYGVIYRPSNFDPAVKYPVVEQIYAGPHGAHVPKAFRPLHGAQAHAELGFLVVQIDGMGTSQRSKVFHDVCWKNLGDSGFPDRIAWLQAAARHEPAMDLSRVGIYGGSAGGQSTLRGLLMHGDFYKVGVADCGCHDNRMDKVWWNELWMGWPLGQHYEEQSNVTQAHRLQGRLLLIVGELDRNVDPASTMQVVDALVRADKDFDLLIIPGAGHGAAETPYGRRRRADFLVRYLLGVEPRLPVLSGDAR